MNSQEVTPKDEMTGRQRKQLITLITNALDATKKNVESIVGELKLTNTQAQRIITGQNFNKEQLRTNVKEAILKGGIIDEHFSTHIIDCDKAPLIPHDGWKVEEHIKGGQFTWNPEKVKLFLSVNQKDDKSIEGNKLRKELKDQPVMNANLLDYLLDHPNLIPEEWKVDEKGSTRYVFFWGTIYRSSIDNRFVCGLCFNGGRWKRSNYCLDYVYAGHCPACVSAN